MERLRFYSRRNVPDPEKDFGFGFGYKIVLLRIHPHSEYGRLGKLIPQRFRTELVSLYVDGWSLADAQAAGGELLNQWNSSEDSSLGITYKIQVSAIDPVFGI